MIDRAFQFAYVCAYQLMRIYWRVTKPTTHGALVAIWHAGRVLLVKNSYVSYYSLPGGYVRASETGRQAAVRELKEEVSLDITEEQLELALDVTRSWEGKQDRVELFKLNVNEAPNVQIDNREVVSAELLTPEEALQRRLFPTLRQHIEQVARLGQPATELASIPAE